jgi:hypothetical protein
MTTEPSEHVQLTVTDSSDHAISEANVADDSLNVLKRNWDFEEEDSEGGPDGWDYYGSSWGRSNDSYQDFVANDSYSGRIQAQGMQYDGSWVYLSQYPGSVSAYLDEDLELEFWWWVESMPDTSTGSWCYFEVQLNNGTNYNLRYYLATGSSISSNSSTRTSYLLNDSILQWNHFKQNLLDDFNDRPGWTASSNLYVTQLLFQIYSPEDASGIAEAIIDDVSLTNSTAHDYLLTRNGNFEDGSGSYWSWSGQNDPGYITLTDESLHGNKALNLSASSIVVDSWSQIHFEQEIGNPYGVIPFASDVALIDFDWNYQDTYNGDDQSAYLSLYFSNDTYWSSVSIYLGNNMNNSMYGNTTQPTYSYYYIEGPGFGSRGEWNHFHLDVYDLVSDIGLFKMGFYDVEVYAETSGYTNASVELLIDSFRVLTYPTGHAGFELEEDGRSTPLEIPGWNNNGPQAYFNHTPVSHSGNWAGNITPAAGASGSLSRDLRYQLDATDNIDFWWYLDGFTSPNSGFAFLQISFEGWFYVYYYMALDSGLSPSNDSDEVHYVLPEVNTTSTWIHTMRNIAQDADAAFGSNSWNVTTIILYANSDGAGRTSVVFDDVTIKDTVTPTGIPVAINPIYYSPTTVIIDADDNRAGVEEVDLYYNSGSGWTSTPATYEFTRWSATIPMLPWNTSVDFFATITDYAGHTTISDNGGNNYTLVVGDDISPTVSIDSPSNESTVIDTVSINVTASDVGSDIARVEFLVDSISIHNDSTAPYSLAWDSRAVSNGTHTLYVRAFDNEGLMSEDSVVVNVQNDVAPPMAYHLMLNPTQPEYGQAATVSITLLDASNIQSVTLFYAVEPYSAPSSMSLGQTWASVSMDADGPVFSAEIPAQDYWNTILYYVIAQDVYDQITYIGTESEPLEYDVGDSDNPSLSINGPVEGSSVKGAVEFTTSAVDAGSGVSQIRFYVDGNLVSSSNSASTNFTWDTTQHENGAVIVTFQAEDYAGNTFQVELTYIVANPDIIGSIVDSASSFMSSYGFFVGAATVLLGFGLIKIIMNRRAAGGKPKGRKKK